MCLGPPSQPNPTIPVRVLNIIILMVAVPYWAAIKKFLESREGEDPMVSEISHQLASHKVPSSRKTWFRSNERLWFTTKMVVWQAPSSQTLRNIWRHTMWKVVLTFIWCRLVQRESLSSCSICNARIKHRSLIRKLISSKWHMPMQCQDLLVQMLTWQSRHGNCDPASERQCLHQTILHKIVTKFRLPREITSLRESISHHQPSMIISS